MLLSVISANGLQYRSTSTAPTEHVQKLNIGYWTFIHSLGHELCKHLDLIFIIEMQHSAT